jgi:hypothetical protein
MAFTPSIITSSASAITTSEANEDVPALFFLNSIIPPSYPIHAYIINGLSKLLLLPAQQYK